MWTCVPAWLAAMSLWWCWEEARAGLLQRWAVAGVGQWVKVRRDLNTALQKKKKLFPLSILRESPLIHRWVFLRFLFFRVLIAACWIPCSVFLSPCVLLLSLRPVCLPSCVSISSSLRFGFSALSLIFIPSSSSLSAFLCDETCTWFFRRGSESSRKQRLNFG